MPALLNKMFSVLGFKQNIYQQFIVKLRIAAWQHTIRAAITRQIFRVMPNFAHTVRSS